MKNIKYIIKKYFKNKNMNKSFMNNNFNKNKSLNTIIKRKENNKHSSNIINSISTSAGLSISSNKINESFIYNNSKNNSQQHDKNINSNIANDINNRNDNINLIEERDYYNHKINNFNYEKESDDVFNENMLF